jgi:hypothetical protein
MASYTDSEKRNSEASRLRTTLQGFGQAVVITQNGINANLEASWKPHQTTMDTADATIVGTLAAPSVEFIESEKTKAIFYVNLSKVDVTIYVIVNRHEAPKEVKRTYSNWSLAYEVDFSFETIAELPDEIKRQVKSLRDYTAQQIVIDFSTANLDEARPKYSKYEGLKLESGDQDYQGIKDAMDSFGKHWISQVKDKKVPATNILGYALKSDPAKGPQATLAPKDVTFQMYPYYKNGNSIASEFVREDSCFCFLNVFEGHDFPRVSAGGAVKKLDFAGNLVTPFSQISKSGITMPAAGSVTLSGDAFWAKMKPTLDALSRATFFSVTSVSSYADTWYPNNSYDYSIGIGDKNTDAMPSLSKWFDEPPAFPDNKERRMSMMNYDQHQRERQGPEHVRLHAGNVRNPCLRLVGISHSRQIPAPGRLVRAGEMGLLMAMVVRDRPLHSTGRHAQARGAESVRGQHVRRIPVGDGYERHRQDDSLDDAEAHVHRRGT